MYFLFGILFNNHCQSVITMAIKNLISQYILLFKKVLQLLILLLLGKNNVTIFGDIFDIEAKTMMNDKYATTDISEYINGYSDTKYW